VKSIPDIGPLVYGTLPMGPLQAGLSPEEGGRLIAHALISGVTTVDTAEMYGTYAHIRRATELSGHRPVVITKTHAATAGEARDHLEKALRELGVERLDVANVHGARLENPFDERSEVFAEILKMIDEGKVGALGLSTHRFKVVEMACGYPEISFIHPLINKLGLGIIDGGASQMAAAIERVAQKGKVVYAMKALAGGNLISEAYSCLEYVRTLPGVASLAVGMLSEAEVDANVAYFLHNKSDPQVWEALSKRQRRLVVMKQFCVGCGTCVETCSSMALTLVEGKVSVDASSCVLCGYCAPSCPAFLLRIV